MDKGKRKKTNMVKERKECKKRRKRLRKKNRDNRKRKGKKGKTKFGEEEKEEGVLGEVAGGLEI